jgi:Ohr subfamily peroxiredoxin
MSSTVYTAEATVRGGRFDGHARTSDGSLDLVLRAPRELGGEGGGANPEQLFAIGYAACFASALGTAARRARIELGEVNITARVSLVTMSERRFGLAVELDVMLPTLEEATTAAAIVAAAHEVCPYSNATRGNVEVTLTANGVRVGV